MVTGYLFAMIQNNEVEGIEQGEAIKTGWPEGSSRVVLRRVTAHDQDEFVGLVQASAELHHPYIALPATPEAFQEYLRRCDDPSSQEGLLVCLRDTGVIAGSINIQSIIRGRFQC